MDEEIKVSELPEVLNINDDDVIMIIQNGANKIVKAKNIKILVVDNLASDSATDALSANANPTLPLFFFANK